ncbi:MipA/OmpV family protein [Vibrio crassostreae]|uniref:MipA/OmpV family protein n=1 Tax=Vibrio crassostreae TaxID=246167 RepID=UPI00104A4919|nr:MipA/OmpV family protein [Vibrio crassostreae]TCV29210.1 outer membrane protein [Vibrio crassostreae]
MKTTLIAAMIAALSIPSIANAKGSEFGLGLTAAYSPNVYKGGDTEVTPFPLLSYDNGHFFIEGVQAGYRLAPKGSVNNIVFFAAYDPRTLDAGESGDADIKKLDDRDSTFMGGAAYVLTTNIGEFRVGAGTDIGSVHNGLYVETRYSYHMNFGAFGLIPAIGYSLNSDKLNEHLYGVSAAEASRTRFDEFKPDWSGRYFVGLSGYMYLSKHLRLTGGVRYENLDSEIEKSPILDSTTSVMGNVGVTYLFK